MYSFINNNKNLVKFYMKSFYTLKFRDNLVYKQKN